MKKKSTILLNVLWIAALLVGLTPLPSAAAQSAGTPDLQAVDAFLRESVSANRIPGLAVALVQGDAVTFARGYGEARSGEAVTPQTQFYIGSMSKSFTALAVMQLVEQGRVELDAPLQQYLPWFETADPQAAAQITVRNLLNHTSGLSEAGDPHAADLTASLEEQARLLKKARLTAPVGTKYQYFNQNYRLLGALVEQISGQRYADYLRTQIFEPLGMVNTTADPAQAPRLAQGHSRAFGFALPQTQIFNPGGVPSGYIISTAEDMAHYLLAQIHNQRPDGQPLLRADLLETMRVPPAGLNSEYGMGWMVMDEGRQLAHGGALETFQAFMLFRPQEQRGLVLLYNQNSLENMLFETGAVRDGLLALFDGQPAPSAAYGWVGWVLLALAAADALTHLRLFSGLAQWVRNAASARRRGWAWARVGAGTLLPAFIVLGLPWVMTRVQGGAPGWDQPFRLQPDLVVWLLLGMTLTFARNALRAFELLRARRAQAI